jgi:cellobiose phosphorylase
VDRLHIAPCLPNHWAGLKIHYRFRETVYHIDIVRDADQGDGARVEVDGIAQPGPAIPLVDDHGEHQVMVCLSAV